MSNKRKVIVDTDFMQYMTRGQNDKKEYYFEKIINDLNVYPVVHEFLYENEMFNNPLVKKLVEENKMTVLYYDDFIEDQFEEEFYSDLFVKYYEDSNHQKITFQNFNFRTYREAKANLGEIHSILLALFTGYDLFLSNDNGAKTIVRTNFNTDRLQLSVKNIIDILDEIALLPEKTMTKKDVVELTKGDKGRALLIKEVKEKWREGAEKNVENEELND